MLIVLPPSETKAPGGDGAPLDFAALSFPALNPRRRDIAHLLASMDVEDAMAVLKVSERLRPEVEANRELFTSPTMPALERFTGVLYDALSPATLSASARSRLVVGDALFGLVGAQDLIPHYRLSAGNKLGGTTMKARWGTAIADVLGGIDKLVVDLRSGAYQKLGRAPRDRTVTVRVETLRDDGTRAVVSHFNKHYKGLLARELAESGAQARGADDVAEIATAAGWVAELRGTEVVLVV